MIKRKRRLIAAKCLRKKEKVARERMSVSMVKMIKIHKKGISKNKMLNMILMAKMRSRPIIYLRKRKRCKPRK